MDQDVPEKTRTKSKKEVSFPGSPQDLDDSASVRSVATSNTIKRSSIQRWLQPVNETSSTSQTISIEPPLNQATPSRQKLMALDTSKAAQLTFKQVVQDSLNPSVTDEEAEDYARYISHPQTLPLVISTETPAEIDDEYLEYVNGSWQDLFATQYISEEDVKEYTEFLTVPDNPLTVTEEDAQKKRYKAYRKWHNGKSLFKQQPID